jgi:hypothetical protein
MQTSLSVIFLSNVNCKVAKHLPYHLKVVDFCPATGARARREKWGKRKKMNRMNKIFVQILN